MNNKRALVITAVAMLTFLVGVTAFLAFARSAESAQPVLVTGLSISGGSAPDQIDRQNLAANRDNKAQWRTSYEEYFRSLQPLPAYRDSKAQWRTSYEEYIRGQQDRYISPQQYEQRQSSK
jgi:hypothetical protein